MVLKYEDIIPTNPEPGITRRILARGGSLMGVEASFKKGAAGKVHKHPHEQVSYIVSGSFEYEANGVTYMLKAGDSYYVEPDVLHGAVALEDSVILDIFTPQREDFIADVKEDEEV
ncbi:cupin domain-containing protein [Lacrimispora brassicae]